MPPVTRPTPATLSVPRDSPCIRAREMHCLWQDTLSVCVPATEGRLPGGGLAGDPSGTEGCVRSMNVRQQESHHAEQDHEDVCVSTAAWGVGDTSPLTEPAPARQWEVRRRTAGWSGAHGDPGLWRRQRQTSGRTGIQSSRKDPQPLQVSGPRHGTSRVWQRRGTQRPQRRAAMGPPLSRVGPTGR